MEEEAVSILKGFSEFQKFKPEGRDIFIITSNLDNDCSFETAEFSDLINRDANLLKVISLRESKHREALRRSYFQKILLISHYDYSFWIMDHLSTEPFQFSALGVEVKSEPFSKLELQFRIAEECLAFFIEDSAPMMRADL